MAYHMALCNSVGGLRSSGRFRHGEAHSPVFFESWWEFDSRVQTDDCASPSKNAFLALSKVRKTKRIDVPVEEWTKNLIQQGSKTVMPAISSCRSVPPAVLRDPPSISLAK